MTQYQPGTYVKEGASPRVARTAAQAVALVFDGFKPSEEKAEVPAAEVTETESTNEKVPDEPTPADAAPKPSAPKETRKP